MGCSILLIDDDASYCAVVRECLEMSGHTVRIAASGVEALTLVEQACPSLILLDLRMPGLDGWGFARELHRRGLHIPIVVVWAPLRQGEAGEVVGAVDYLPKPFDLSQLLEVVERNTSHREN